MGKQDKDEKSEVKQALTEAWDLWTRQDLELQLATAKFIHTRSSPHLSNFEEEQDYETIEKDRLMAMDDDLEDESECDVLNLSNIAPSESIIDTMTQGKNLQCGWSTAWNICYKRAHNGKVHL